MIPNHPSRGSAADFNAATAELAKSAVVDDCVVKVGGDWRLSAPVPSWAGLFAQHTAANVSVVAEHLGRWDSSLLLFLVHGRTWCAESKHRFMTDGLPVNLQILLRQVASAGTSAARKRPVATTLLKRTESLAVNLVLNTTGNISFIGECTLGFVGILRHPRKFRSMDCLVEMQHCWASSLPIVSLVSFLVGVILAFQAAIQLQQYGAAVFVADLVGLSVVREMGPMMAAVIMAGGIGAAFAAQLGNMKVDEEIDALETLGISSIDFLALPRLLAVTLMMPILAVYADVLGILGGVFVSMTMLDIPAAAYWVETQNRVGIWDVFSGLVKSVFFGFAIGVAGCLRGMKCERSAVGVGQATTSAVVTGILLIVIADALFALIFNVLGI